ncbi:MrcB family domain-containing protein [Furfurilactobacillus entadae]|uniref:MrcB family domain-containing protein n=1 Tax=Furfurilactobacillus entadae TaxID=2922307 RepID=UPI0035EC1AE9
MVTLKEYLLHILENYKNEIKNNYKDNPLSEYISAKAKTTISEAIFPQEKYSIKGSSGQGRWATVPWMGIFDKEISISAQRGYYLVYLFKSDLSGVYLSLNQGYTDFKEKYKAPDRNTNIRLVSRYWQKQLHTITENNGSLFTTENISLTSSKSNTDLPRGYELGNIYSRYYSLEDLTQLTNNQLLNDLYQMNTVFLELRTMITTAYDVCNDHIIKSNFEGSNLLNAQDKHDDLNNLNLGTEVLVSKIDFSLPKTTSKKFTHIDYNKRQQKTQV